MIRAVEAVRERLLRSTAALEPTGLSYAVIGANAVAHWVESRDSGAVRNTPNVDMLIRQQDLDHSRSALEASGFVPSDLSATPVAFLDGPAGRPRDAVRLWMSDQVVKADTEPLPDVSFSLPLVPFRVVAPPTLIRMKLSAFRMIDQVHLQAMIGVGLIDATWPDRFPEVLAERLRQILANPDG